MKKMTTISLFIFGVVVAGIISAGLVFYQNDKDNTNTQSSTNTNIVKNTLDKIKPVNGGLLLDMKEISKHNTESDCWMLIDGKVYNITDYFGSHPGGNAAMLATCGKDATDAYMTKDPYATTAGNGSAHSSNARSLLTDYYLGNLNQTIGQVKNTQTTTTPQTSSNPKPSINTQTNNSTSPITTKPVVALPVGNITLNVSEISKHNKSSDCWMLINGKVYNITSYFGSHPGGNTAMLATCGKDATDAYMTKDPYATTASSRSAHSSNAQSLLTNYYIGDLNQTIGEQKIQETNTIVPIAAGEYENEYEDD